MRFLALLGAACALLLAAPTLAQTAPTSTTNSAPNPARIAAARDMLQAAMVDSGALNVAIVQSFTLLAPQLRQQVQAAPFYAGLTPAHQQALNAYFETIGSVASELMGRNVPAEIDAQAPSLAALFTEEEAHDIAAFLRSPEGRSLFLRGVAHGVTDSANKTDTPPPQPTEAEQHAADQFDHTAGGRAFSAHLQELTAAVTAAISAAGAAATPQIRARIYHDMCAAMEAQCPASLRAAGGAG